MHSHSRRQFLRAGLALAAIGLLSGCGALPAGEHSPAGIPRIGVLSPRATFSPQEEAWLAGLRELGYIEGQNIAIEWRFADGSADRFLELAAELARLEVDVLYTPAPDAALPARRATATIPIVFISNGSVKAGLVASLAHPGGNATGLDAINTGLIGKRLELLKGAVPGASRVAVLWNTASATAVPAVRGAQVAAQAMGLEHLPLEVGAGGDFEAAFEAATRWRADGLLAVGDPLFFQHMADIVALASKYRLPTIWDRREFVEGGHLMAYGTNFLDLYRRAATFVDKILKGAKPGDLPVEQPTTFDLVINLKTARAIGLTIPQEVLMQATEVIH